VYAYSLGEPIDSFDPLGLWTASIGLSLGVALPGFGGGGGTFFNLAHDSASGWLSGWSASLTGTALGGAVAGLGASPGVTLEFTNACDVYQLLGKFYELSRGGISRYGLGYLQNPDGTVKGTSLTLGVRPGWGVSGAALTASTTSALVQWSRGAVSFGATDHGAIFTVH
jgi:hypothetical protein